MRFPLNIQRALTSKEIVMMMMIVHDFHSIMWWWGLMSCLLRLGHQFGMDGIPFQSWSKFQRFLLKPVPTPRNVWRQQSWSFKLEHHFTGKPGLLLHLEGKMSEVTVTHFCKIQVKFQTLFWISLELQWLLCTSVKLLLSSYFWRILPPVFSIFIPCCISCVVYVVFSHV